MSLIFSAASPNSGKLKAAGLDLSGWRLWQDSGILHAQWGRRPSCSRGQNTGHGAILATKVSVLHTGTPSGCAFVVSVLTGLGGLDRAALAPATRTKGLGPQALALLRRSAMIAHSEVSPTSVTV